MGKNKNFHGHNGTPKPSSKQAGVSQHDKGGNTTASRIQKRNTSQVDQRQGREVRDNLDFGGKESQPIRPACTAHSKARRHEDNRLPIRLASIAACHYQAQTLEGDDACLPKLNALAEADKKIIDSYPISEEGAQKIKARYGIDVAHPGTLFAFQCQRFIALQIWKTAEEARLGTSELLAEFQTQKTQMTQASRPSALTPLSSNLKTLMKERGLTQSEVAEMVGVKQSSVSVWIKGGGIHPATLRHLALVLKVEVTDLTGDSTINPTAEGSPR